MAKKSAKKKAAKDTKKNRVEAEKVQVEAVEKADGCECKFKDMPRSEELKSDLEKRLNRAIGQLNGIKTMIEQDRYCGDVLTQLAAAQSAVKAVSTQVLKNHLETCVTDEIRKGNDDVIDELVGLMKKFS